MGLGLFGAAIALLVLAFGSLLWRRLERRGSLRHLEARTEAKSVGGHQARLHYPHIDLSRCIGCGACVAACPEDDVLGMVHGQASVIYGARCVGHGRCATACPVGAISLTLANVESRRDLPAISEHFEVLGSPGLFLAGEVTGYALIRTAITQGTAIAERIASLVTTERPRRPVSGSDDWWDLLIVGAGPAGLAASLQAKSRQLKFVTLEQDELGGTVSKYPRRKLVMTQPVSLPLCGTLKRSTYSKEELIELWQSVAREHQLPIRTGQQFTGLSKISGGFQVTTQNQTYRARHVCMAVGRRGTPVKLGVPGEDLTKVAYGLSDAQSYQHRRILVVGGGDSAVEAALGLSAQPGNKVTLSYRRAAFVRLKSRNEAELKRAVHAQQLECVLSSQISAIGKDSVSLTVDAPEGSVAREIANDDVFILAGGIPPFQLLEACGVSFDPADRSPLPAVVDQGTGLFRALTFVLLCAVLLLGWTWVFREYYRLPLVARPLVSAHFWLRPGGPVGLTFGVLAAALFIANLCYLLRRNWLRGILPGSLAGWMTAHVATGILSLFLVLVHAGYAPKNTIGGHAMLALTVLVITGAIGRYFYAFIPRAANGRELELGEIQEMVAADLSQWDRVGQEYFLRVQEELAAVISRSRWDGGIVDRWVGLMQARDAARASIRRVRREGIASGLSYSQVERIAALVDRAYRTALGTTHLDDLRALLNCWRYLHRWVALIMVLLAVAHIALVWRYSDYSRSPSKFNLSSGQRNAAPNRPDGSAHQEKRQTVHGQSQ